MAGTYPIIGNGVSNKTVEEIRKRVADPTEQIFGIFKAKIAKFLDFGVEKYFVAGSKHLTLWDKSPFEFLKRSSTKAVRYSYSKISNVTVKKGFRTYLIIRYEGKKLEYYGLDRKTVDVFSELIRSKMNTNYKVNTIGKAAKVEIKPVDPIEMVKLRYAKGEIGKEEMEEMIKSLKNVDY